VPWTAICGKQVSRPLVRLHDYLITLSLGRAVLWCYLIWYLVMVAFHFEPSLRLWMTSLGISAVIGVGLLLSVSTPGRAVPRDRWQVTRLFLMPFCVSSFSALIKDSGFILIFSPRLGETVLAVFCCGAFLGTVFFLRQRRHVHGVQE
jgi:hypothetical protein